MILTPLLYTEIFFRNDTGIHDLSKLKSSFFREQIHFGNSVMKEQKLFPLPVITILYDSLLRGFDQARFNGIPVDNVPDCLDITGPDVSVIHVVGMLPDVDT